jgi:hypothetical protein
VSHRERDGHNGLRSLRAFVGHCQAILPAHNRNGEDGKIIGTKSKPGCKWRGIGMKTPGLSHSWWFRIRKCLSAGVWLVLPPLSLLGFRSSPWQGAFRAQPFNNSYDAMFIAATAGIGLTSLWIVFTASRYTRGVKNVVVPACYSWFNAFDLFELCACASLGIFNFLAGTPGSGVLWSIAFSCLLVGTMVVSQTEKGIVFETSSRHTQLSWPLSIGLIALAALFILFPVLQPWSGPPEPFVRWHPFSLSGELIWRGIFLSFAFGMILTAFDPLGRHRSFLVLLVLSGYLHSGEMAADNVLSAAMGGMNGNPEHLYGDVLGWFVIASISLLFLILNRDKGT